VASELLPQDVPTIEAVAKAIPHRHVTRARVIARTIGGWRCPPMRALDDSPGISLFDIVASNPVV
jgi:hypothetical protein